MRTTIAPRMRMPTGRSAAKSAVGKTFTSADLLGEGALAAAGQPRQRRRRRAGLGLALRVRLAEALLGRLEAGQEAVHRALRRVEERLRREAHHEDEQDERHEDEP